jgi:hypothetical protein
MIGIVALSSSNQRGNWWPEVATNSCTTPRKSGSDDEDHGGDHVVKDGLWTTTVPTMPPWPASSTMSHIPWRGHKTMMTITPRHAPQDGIACKQYRLRGGVGSAMVGAQGTWGPMSICLYSMCIWPICNLQQRVVPSTLRDGVLLRPFWRSRFHWSLSLIIFDQQVVAVPPWLCPWLPMVYASTDAGWWSVKIEAWRLY